MLESGVRAFVVVVLVGGCTERALGLTGTDASQASIVDASSTDLPRPDLAGADLLLCPHPFSGALCSASLSVVKLTAQPGCVFIENVTKNVGQLVFPCAGGDATATFGPDTFSGTVAGQEAHLKITVPFDWSDGCHWATTQTLDGEVCGSLSWVYTEGPLPGQVGCTTSCSESATLQGS
jgi:hypothetical protein